jgi:5-methylcytosine-specific restriction endonuclease McrA
VNKVSKESKLALCKSRKAAGICVRCGLKFATERSYNCVICSKIFADSSKKRRQKRIAEGLCYACGKRLPQFGKSTCEDCSNYQYSTGISGHYRHFFLSAAHRRLHEYDRKIAFGLWCIWKKQRGLCALTGEKLNAKNSSLDHIIPKSRGGTDDFSNLRWLTKEANIAKQALFDLELFDLCEKILRHQRKF